MLNKQLYVLFQDIKQAKTRLKGKPKNIFISKIKHIGLGGLK